MRAPFALLALAVLVAGCGEDGNPLHPQPLPEMRVLGLGRVSDRFTAELWVRGTTAYTTTWGSRTQGVFGNAIKIWDVSGATPVLVDSVLVPGALTLGDVEVSDDGSVLLVPTEPSPGSVAIYDVSTTPRSPRLLVHYTSDSLFGGVHTAELERVGGRLYAFLSVNPRVNPTFAPRLVVLDLSDPANPTQALVLRTGNPTIHDVFVRDGILFTAIWDGGLRILDIGGGGRGGTVAAPVPLGVVQTIGGNVHNVWWVHDPTTGAKRYAIVGEEGPAIIGSSASGDIHVVDVSDMASPREVAFFRVPGAGTHNFSVDEARGILYAAYYNGGVRALDVRGDLGTCSTAERAPDGRCDLGLMGRELARGLTESGAVYVWGVHYTNGFVYASDMLNGLWKLEAVTR